MKVTISAIHGDEKTNRVSAKMSIWLISQNSVDEFSRTSLGDLETGALEAYRSNYKVSNFKAWSFS